jgi:cytidine deaminase
VPEDDRKTDRLPAHGTIDAMSEAAWTARDNARILGATPVGCAALSDAGVIYAGCNVEHRFRSHDIHAEPNALSSLVAAGGKACVAVLVVAERDKFTPCGSCMDWIFEIGGPNCQVGFQPRRSEAVTWYAAAELMPHYPY